MISQTAEYALRAMVFLAMNTDAPQVTEKIAAGTKVPAGYLSKVLQSLSRAELVKSQRGIGGGFTLVKPVEATSILEIVNAVDPIKRIETCPLDLSSHGYVLCALHKRLDEAIGMVEDAFEKTTLAEDPIEAYQVDSPLRALMSGHDFVINPPADVCYRLVQYYVCNPGAIM